MGIQFQLMQPTACTSVLRNRAQGAGNASHVRAYPHDNTYLLSENTNTLKSFVYATGEICNRRCSHISLRIVHRLNRICRNKRRQEDGKEMLPLIPPGFAGRASWQLHGCNWSVRSAWDGSRLAGVWLWLTVGDCLADSGGALRFGAPGVARPPRSILANYINGLGTVEKIRTRPRTVEGTKARRKGTHFLPNNSLLPPPQ